MVGISVAASGGLPWQGVLADALSRPPEGGRSQVSWQRMTDSP